MREAEERWARDCFYIVLPRWMFNHVEKHQHNIHPSVKRYIAARAEMRCFTYDTHKEFWWENRLVAAFPAV